MSIYDPLYHSPIKACALVNLFFGGSSWEYCGYKIKLLHVSTELFGIISTFRRGDPIRLIKAFLPPYCWPRNRPTQLPNQTTSILDANLIVVVPLSVSISIAFGARRDYFILEDGLGQLCSRTPWGRTPGQLLYWQYPQCGPVSPSITTPID